MSRRSSLRVLAVGATAALAASLGFAPAQAATIPELSTTMFGVDGARGSSLLGLGATLGASGTSVSVSATAGQVTWSTTPAGGQPQQVVLADATNQQLVSGTHITSETGGTGVPRLSVSGFGRSCSTSLGDLTVHWLHRNASGVIDQLAASFLYRCDGGPALPGELRLNSTVGLERFGAYPMDTRPTSPNRVVTVKVPANTALGTSRIEGSTSFRIVSDGCRGRAASASAGTCTVTVTTYPQTGEGALGTLVVPKAASGEIGRVSLTAVGRDTGEGTYTALTPARILDTRAANGVTTRTKWPSGGTIGLQVTGRGGVPTSGVRAVVMNLTVTGPTAPGWGIAYPAGSARPSTSSINYAKDWTGANLVTMPVGTGGKVDIYVSASTHVIVDVLGYYRAAGSTAPGIAGSYVPYPPYRAINYQQARNTKLPANAAFVLGIDLGPAANSTVRAFAVNITAVQPEADGFLTAWDGQTSLPNASTLNFTVGRNVPNMAMVPTGTCPDCFPGKIVPSIMIMNQSAKPTNVIVDLVGYVDDGTRALGTRFKPISPRRIVDTRLKLGIPAALGPGVTRTVTTPNTIAGSNTRALVGNLTAVAPTRATWLVAWPTTLAQPVVSNLNPYTGQVVANMVITQLGDAKKDFNVYNYVGTAPVLYDVTGTFEAYPLRPPGVL